VLAPVHFVNLQEDLDKFAQWGKDWFMQFHPAKCTVLTVTNDEIFRFLRRKPRVLFALFVMESMCWLQFTLSVMVTPRYLADVTAASNCPRMVYSVTMGFRLLVTVTSGSWSVYNDGQKGSS
jgi:hypothetical protein